MLLFRICGELLTYGCSILSRRADAISVGPPLPETMGLTWVGVLWILVSKYMYCVLTSSGLRLHASASSCVIQFLLVAFRKMTFDLAWMSRVVSFSSGSYVAWSLVVEMK